MKKSALVLFSGGSDSTWLVYRLAQEYEHIHLLSLDRAGFYKTKEYTSEKARTLKKYFGSRRITHQVFSIQKMHRTLLIENYAANLLRFKTLMASLSFSKLAFHWAAVLVARENSITDIFDGGTGYMNMYPDQNREIGFKNYQKLYQSFGLQYQQPLFEDNLDVEAHLYNVGLVSREKVRGTSEDRQVFYIEQVLLAHFLNYYLSFHGWEKYETKMGELYAEKIRFIQNQIPR